LLVVGRRSLDVDAPVEEVDSKPTERQDGKGSREKFVASKSTVLPGGDANKNCK